MVAELAVEGELWGWPRIEGIFFPPTGDDFCVGPDEFLPCWDDRVDDCAPLLVVEVDVVLGLPPALLEIEEVVGEPTTTGGEGDWVLLGADCP